jgi:PKD repeat protein
LTLSNKKYFSMKRFNTDLVAVAMVIIISSLVISCKYDVKDLGPKPEADFTITPVAGMVNKYLLTSTSTNSFRFDWDKATGAGYVQGSKVDTVYFPDAGTYTIKLLAYGQSGMDSAVQNLVVTADDPAAQTPFKILTGNSSRKWKLAPEAGALFIGPPDFSQTWWASGLGDITSRSCLFNDEYTFTKTGSVMSYDSKNDFYVDEEAGVPHPAGMPPVGCYANSAIPAQFQAWANSGNFTFEVINNTKLKVNGLGAHLGLYKAGTTNAALSAPETSVTYDIVSITPTRLVIKLDYGWGAWRFTYVAI